MISTPVVSEHAQHALAERDLRGLVGGREHAGPPPFRAGGRYVR